MKKRFRNGETVEQNSGQDRLLHLLYGTVAGRLLLKPLIHPAVSRAGGWFLSSRLSCGLIRPFIEQNEIDMSQFEQEEYRNYNEFFSRRIRPEARPIDGNPEHFISPCDSKLSVYPIGPDTRVAVKHTVYTVTSLLQNYRLAKAYEGGYLLLFRLTVDDYHRYCYAADGVKGENIRIPGVFHTVNPVANDVYPIYKENTREYSILHTETFGDILMMEVGALLVGKIVNHHGRTEVKRGQEKGYFQFGGSTVILLVPRGMLTVDEDILRNSGEGIETVVKLGEKIGKRADT